MLLPQLTRIPLQHNGKDVDARTVEAVLIDNVGVNRPLIAEIGGTQPLVFEPGETWEIVLDDWINLSGLDAAQLSSIGVPSSRSSSTMHVIIRPTSPGTTPPSSVIGWSGSAGRSLG